MLNSPGAETVTNFCLLIEPHRASSKAGTQSIRVSGPKLWDEAEKKNSHPD